MELLRRFANLRKVTLRKNQSVRFRYSVILVTAVLLVISATSCALIVPTPTPVPLPILLTATVQPSPTATETLPPGLPGVPTLPPSLPTHAPTTIPQSSGNPPPSFAPPAPVAKRIVFATGATSTMVQGSVAAGGLDRWVIRVLGGQTMNVTVTPASGSVVLIVYGADGSVLQSDHAGASAFSGIVPSTQDYILDVRGPVSIATTYTLQVVIPPLSREAPTLVPKRISFAPGATSATVQSHLPAGQIERWVLRALAGQTMTVNTSATQGAVILIIWGGQDGVVLISDHAGATSWSGKLPTTEDYYIDVRSLGITTANYWLQVTIPPK